MLESVCGALADGIAVHDSSGSLILACPFATRILGLVQERVKRIAAGPRWHGGKEGGSPIPGDEVQALASLRRGRPARNIVLRLEEPSSAGRWILAHVHAIGNPDNPWYGCVISTFVDMTAAKPVDAGLDKPSAQFQETSQRLLFAVEAGHVGAWELDPATLEFRWGEQMFEMYGMRVQDDVPESIWRDRIMPEDMPAVQMKFQNVLLGRNSSPIEFRITRADGAVRHMLMTAAMAFDHARQPVCVGLTLDQTDHFEIEQALRRVQSRQHGSPKTYSEVP